MMAILSRRFCIAVNRLDVKSETFILNHVQNILPNSTALIALDKSGKFPSEFSPEVCFNVAERRRFLPQKMDSLLSLLIGGSVFYLNRNNNQQLATFLKMKGVKVLLAEYGPVACSVLTACQISGVNLYVHFHGYDASVLIRSWHVRYAYRRLFRLSSGFIFPSNFLANKLCSAIGIKRNEKIHVVPCCVQPDEFNYEQPKDKRLILAVGRFVDKKAPNKTILAFSKVLREFPDLRLEMIGDGELLTVCKKLAKSLGIENKVIFYGGKSHNFVKEKMQSAALFFQHSVTAPNGDTEGLGVSLLEAMASGAVVVATKHNGFLETVVDGETGLLVDEHDVDGMAQCCLRLLRDVNLANSMREKARSRIEKKFTVVQQVALLRSIMGLEDV